MADDQSGGVVATAGPTARTAADDEVKLADVPKPVMNAANRILPGATWQAAVKVTDGEKVAYEFDGSDGKDRDVTVLVTAEGKVVEVETELKKADNVPEAVLNAVKAKWPNFTPTETHVIRQGTNLKGGKDGDRLFDMRGTIAKGERDIDVQVSEKGELLEWTVEIAEEKVPAVVMAALKRERPKFEIGTRYALHEGKKLIGYHFEGKGAGGRDRTVSVTPDGKQVEVIE